MTVFKPRHLCLASVAQTCLSSAASDGQRGGRGHAAVAFRRICVRGWDAERVGCDYWVIAGVEISVKPLALHHLITSSPYISPLSYLFSSHWLSILCLGRQLPLMTAMFLPGAAQLFMQVNCCHPKRLTIKLKLDSLWNNLIVARFYAKIFTLHYVVLWYFHFLMWIALCLCEVISRYNVNVYVFPQLNWTFNCL